MEILPLVVEGIENKIKKLAFNNQQLKKENLDLQDEKQVLEERNQDLAARIQQQEEVINKLKVAKVLSGKDNLQARQKINELLREIEKCYALLNR